MFLSDKDIYESLNFLVISILRKAGNPLAGFLRFIIFTFSLAEIRLCRTDVRRRNGYSTILHLFWATHLAAPKSADRKSEGVNVFIG